MAIINLRVDDEMEQSLDEIANLTSRTRSEVVRDAVRRLLDESKNELMAVRPAQRAPAVIGAWSGPGNLSERTGAKFAAHLKRKKR